MRLLQCDENGRYSLTSDLAPDKVPRYAILSHTWGSEEVVFADVLSANDNWQRKAGFDKIRFCGEQAKRDGLQHFWVDTCCINKADSAELQTAINSMFKWYRDAAKCYVFLTDVTGQGQGPGDVGAFCNSRWFCRGWTLQELLAPASVEFFSKEEVSLGTKESLEPKICEITGIPAGALRGIPLTDFSISERQAWVQNRETTYEEDMAYSLFGIFEVFMPLIYGEGRDHAFKRLREEVQKAAQGSRRDDFSVPFSLANVPAIQHFVARENELLELQKSLVGDGTRHVAVLHGLGGIGKTQLAIAYAKGYRDNYSAVFWLNIKDEVSAKQGFIRIAGQILQSHPTASPFTSIDLQKDQDKVVEAVKAWLSLPSNTRWLMIYDNYDTPRLANTTVPGDVDIRQFLPDAYQGSVIVTTRSAQVDLGHLIRIRRLEFIDDSLGILERILGTENLKSDPDAVELANELDGLPLALATAGAYLHRVPTSFGDYLRLYKESWARLHNSTPSLGSYEDRTLCSTWQLSYKTIEEQHKSAAGLLRWWAYFDNQDLWYELVKHTDSASPGWMLELIKDELCFNDAIGILNEYGLVERNGADTRAVRPAGYNMHSCVHSWVYHVLNEEPDPNLERLAMVCVASHVPLPDMFYLESHALPPDMIKASKIQKRLLSHALRWNSVARNETCNDMEWAFHNLGLLFDNERWLQNAEEMYLRALDLCEKTWGPDHSPIFITAHNLGNVYTNQGRLPEAEKMLIRARQGKEKAWGPDHISTLSTVILLGNLYKVRGDFHKAEDMFVQAIQGYEKTQGPGRIMLFETLNNLGYLYAEHGKPRKAEEMYLRAIEGFEKARGSGYTSIHRVILNLGILYTKQGKLQKAEKIWLRALHAREKAWGSNHVKTLDVIASLAYLYHSQGRLQEAEDMSLKALQGYEVAMGPDHIHKCWPALNSLQHLGDLAVIAGMPARAHEMYTRAFYGLELWLGPSDVRVAHIQDTLDSLEKSMSKKPRMKGKGLLEQRLTESAAGDAGAQNTTSKVRKSMQRFTEFMQR